MFLVDASEFMPSAKEWPAVWEKQEAWKASKIAHEKETVSFTKLMPLSRTLNICRFSEF